MKQDRLLIAAGAVVLLFVIFGVPAILVPTAMDNVPERSRFKVVTLYGTAIKTIEANFSRHADPDAAPGRLEPLPTDSKGWVQLLNPMGRKAPGGGQAILMEADDETGAIGVEGDATSVRVTLPAFAGLERTVTVITAESQKPPH